MHVKIPMHPWKGDHSVAWEDASILTVLDRWHLEAGKHPVHVIEIGGVQIICQGFSLRVQPQDVWIEFVAHNIYESSWNKFMEKYDPDDWMQGSGRITFDEIDGEPVQNAAWWPGCDLIVPVTSFELEPIKETVIA